MPWPSLSFWLSYQNTLKEVLFLTKLHANACIQHNLFFVLFGVVLVFCFFCFFSDDETQVWSFISGLWRCWYELKLGSKAQECLRVLFSTFTYVFDLQRYIKRDQVELWCPPRLLYSRWQGHVTTSTNQLPLVFMFNGFILSLWEGINLLKDVIKH